VNKLASYIAKFTLAMLVLASMALFVVPVTEQAEAQSGNNVISFCFRASDAAMILPSESGACPSGYTMNRASRPAGGVCLASSPPFTPDSPSLNDAGTAPLVKDGRCLDDEGNDAGRFKAYPTEQYNPGGTGNTNGNGNGNGNTNNNGNNGNNNNSNGSGNSNGNITPPAPQVQGNCETGFHKAGPLCLPNSPFDDNSIAGGNTTIAQLVVRIIRILLYFAGIVAIIMIIVGGYQVMTAAGDTAQATNGRKTLTNAIIGLAIVLLAYIIVQAVTSFLTKGP
jgi:hypothetical protein